MKFLILLLLFSCAQKKQAEIKDLPDNLAEAIDGRLRDPIHVDRDEFQHPLRTLEFFGLKPTMTVVEISPGAGYYAEILAPYLSREGQYIMAVPRLPSRPPQFLKDNEKRIQELLLAHPEIQRKSKLIPFEPIDKKNKKYAPKLAYADLVLTFTSVHNWVGKKTVHESFEFFFDVLKKGGVLGITQHRIAPGKKRFPMSGYMTEAEVIALAKRAGFKFVAKSEINANPKDTANYPQGVWVLPPTYRLGDKDRDRYEEIGESDRMTLKFVKP